MDNVEEVDSHLEQVMPETWNSPADVQVPEQEHLAAQNIPDKISPSDLNLGLIPIRARISEDANDEDEVGEEAYDGEEENEESFNSSDSATERMSATSGGDIASPVEFYAEAMPFSVDSINAQRSALMQLNQLNSGVSSLDTSIIENTSEEQFRNRIMDIAVAKGLPLDDEMVHSILAALVPVVRATNNGSGSGIYFLQLFGGDHSRSIPVAKPTIEDEDEDDVDVWDSLEANENQLKAIGHVENEGLLQDTARGFPVRAAEYESEEQDDFKTLAPSEAVAVNQTPDKDIISKQPDSSLGVIDDQVNKEAGSIGDLGSSTSSASRSLSENDILEESVVLCSNSTKSCSHHQSHGAVQSPNELIGSSISSSFDVIDHHISKDNIDLTYACTTNPQEMTNVQVNQITQSDNTNVDANLLMNLLKEDNNYPIMSNITEKDNLIHELQGLHDNTVEANNPNVSESEHVIENVDRNQMLGDTDGDTEYENGTDDSGGDDDKDENSITETSSLLDAFIKSFSSQVQITDIPSLSGAGPSLPVHPSGLGRAIPFLEHLSRSVQGSTVSSASVLTTPEKSGHSNSELSEDPELENAEKQLQAVRVKFLRLAHRLGQPANNVVVSQVLYRLGLAEQLRRGQESGRTQVVSFERATTLAAEQEASGTDDLDFGCTILVLGKTGVGKSATINSLFDESKSVTDAYNPGTQKLQAITGTVHGIKLTVIDTPGLFTSFADQNRNKKNMSSVKRFMKQSPPDIVLYFDRLDMPCRDYGDLPLLRTITDTFGATIWFNAIVVLTHASSALPDGANGVPASYEMFVAQRSHIVQQTIRQAAGDIRLTNPVSLVENHPACRIDSLGQYVLPNGHTWKPQLLLLCFASKILAEANTFLKLRDSSPIRPFSLRPRMPPLPFLLSSMLQSREQMKHPDEVDHDANMLYSSDEEAASDDEEDFDDLPPFRHLTRAELALLDKEQRKIYHEELDYREQLFLKKQLKEERARKKELKGKANSLAHDVPDYHYEDQQFGEESASGAVPVPMPDMTLPLSFDSDNPTYRYRYIDTTNQWLVRPVLETNGWDHDSGYDGLNVEKTFMAFTKIPTSVSGQITKDKKEASMHVECNGAFKSRDGKVTVAGVDIQTVGKELAYTVRSETRFDNFKRNRTSCGLSVTTLVDTISAGMKLEDQLLLGKQCKLLVNGGVLTGRGDVAYGGSLEATVKSKDYPIVQTFCTMGLSVMNWHGDFAIGGNLQLQFKVSKTVVGARANLNKRGTGQITIRTNSTEQLLMALIGLIPLLNTCFKRILHSVQ